MSHAYTKMSVYYDRSKRLYTKVCFYEKKQFMNPTTFEYEEKNFEMADCYYYEDEDFLQFLVKETLSMEEFSKQEQHFLFIRPYSQQEEEQSQASLLSLIEQAKSDEEALRTVKKRYVNLILFQIKKKQFILPATLSTPYLLENILQTLEKELLLYEPHHSVHEYVRIVVDQAIIQLIKDTQTSFPY